MKRIYLISAVLVLFAIATVGLFYAKGDKKTPEPSNTAAATAQPTEVIPEPAVDNAPASPVVEPVTTPAAEPVLQVEKSHSFTGWNGKKQNGKNRNSPPATTVSAAQQPAAYIIPIPGQPTNRITLNATLTPDMSAVAVNRDYHGYVPVKTPAAKRTMPKRHGAPLWGRTVQFGPEIGFNMNELHHNNNTANMSTGYLNAGVAINIRLGDHVAIQPTPRYIVKGNRVGDNLDATINEKIALHYISLPVDLVAKFGKPGNARVMLGAGPYVSYLAGTHHFYSAPGYMDVINPPGPVYNTAHMQDIDWGLNSFIGVESPEGLFVKAGLEYGLKDIQRNPATGMSTDRNYSLLFSVGYLIGGVR